MRFTSILAATLAFAGVASATPAAADTALTKSVVGASTVAQPGNPTTADQYRGWRGDRRGWRGDRGWRGGNGWRGNSRFRGGYGYRSSRSWRRGQLVCQTTWYHRRPIRRCYRVY